MRPEVTMRLKVNDSLAVRGNFSEDCEPFPGKRVVLATVGAEYMEMFTNWLGSALPFLKETEHLHVIAEDWEVVGPLEALQKEAHVEFSVGTPQEKQSLLQGDSEHATRFGDKSYGGVVWRRPIHILEFLSQGCSVLYADIDTVWTKDVFLDIAAAGAGDIYLTDDSNVTHWNYCTCFMYMHPSHATMNLLVQWGSHRTGNFNQQEFNVQLFQALNATDATRPNLKALPFESYPPGHWADEVPSPSVFHANWLKGIPAKVKWFQQRSLWNPTALTSLAR